MFVIKRDGTKEEFCITKIENAMLKAFNECITENAEEDRNECKLLAEEVVTKLEGETPHVEDIQDEVELVLMQHGYFGVAKKYITYRYLHNQARNQYKEMMEAVSKKLEAKDVQNQNANMDEWSFGGRINEATSLIMKQYALDYCMSKMAKENHLNNEIYIHDLDHYAVGDHNCMSIPFDELLAKGFNTRQIDVRPAGSLNTAMQLVAVIFQLQSLQQFGGVSATHLDWTMVPYVRKSFYKHWKDGNKFIHSSCETVDRYSPETPIDEYSESEATEYAKEMTERECHQAVEALYHNLNTLQSRSGCQLPFTSINYGTCTLPEGRMVTKELLTVSIEGLGKHHRTSIFPCGIFQCMKGVNRKPEDPNYDLFQLALKSTATRLYPNYANCDWSVNKGYDKSDPRQYVATMGALAGHEHLYIRIDDGDPVDVSIRELFEYCKTGELSINRKVKIWNNKERLNIKARGKQFQQKTGMPNEAGVYSVTYIPEDVTYIGSSSSISRRVAEHKGVIKTTGGLDAGPIFGDSDINNYRFDVLEITDNYKEREKFYIQNNANINIRGISEKIYKSINHSCSVNERPLFVMDSSVPQEFIDLSECDIKVYDRDNKWVKIKHIFKNDKYNTPLMMHIFYKEFDKKYCLSCTEDHPLWNGNSFVRADKLSVGDHIYRADGMKLEICEIGWHWEAVESFDIGTETGSFIGSDIIMHNCRTYNGFDINGLGQQKDGRGNICPVTIILPTLAMEADRDVEKFMLLLEKKINEAKDMLIERFEYICKQSPESARFMYENNIMAGYVPEEGIRSALKHGTLALGQLGLAETLEILLGCNHTKPEGMELAKRIEQLFNTRCKEFKEQYKLNIGVYYTPAENLCHTAMKKFQNRYGIIPKVSDKEYFTNSIHVPVSEEISIFKKIDIESQLTGYSNAGCITYIELDGGVKHNPEALEEIVNYAVDKDIPYFAVNIPVDHCMNCHYDDEIDSETCPECGSVDIERLRRVTGYLTGNYKTAFNKGKQQEVEQRVKHNKFKEE